MWFKRRPATGKQDRYTGVMGGSGTLGQLPCSEMIKEDANA